MVTTPQRADIVRLVVAMFDVAPGATYLQDLEVAFQVSRSLDQLARDLANTSAYRFLNPNTQTGAEFAHALLAPLGLENDATAIAFVTAKFNAGISKGEIAYATMAALEATTDATYSDAKAILANKSLVAEYMSVNLGATTTDLAALHAAVASVTRDPTSVAAAEWSLYRQYGSGGPAKPEVPDPTPPKDTGTTSGSATGTASGAGQVSGTTGPAAPGGTGGAAEDPGAPGDPGSSAGSSDWDSEHGGSVPPDPGGPVMVWDNDLQAWIPALASSGPSSTRLDAHVGGDLHHAVATTLVGVAEATVAAWLPWEAAHAA